MISGHYQGIAIILCRNSLTLTKACLRTLLNQTAGIAVLAVDNASSDGTTNWLISEQVKEPRLFRHTSSGAESVARLWNAALDWSWREGFDRALVVNNDTELRPDTYQLLSRYMTEHEGERVGMVTGVGQDKPDTRDTIPDLVVRPHPDFSCFMIAKWAHQAVRFDERFVGAYFEDCDAHIRMHRAGIQAVSLNVAFLHRSSGTLKSADKTEKKRIEQAYALNKDRFYAMYGCLPGTVQYEDMFLLNLNR